LLKLGGSGLRVVIANHHAPDARGAYVAGNVDSDALLFEPGEIFAKRPPIGVNMIVIVLLLIGAENGIAERGDGFTFTCYLRGDALIDF